MKQQNKWEKLFEEWLDLTEFSLIKHKNPELILKYEDPDGNPVEEIHEGVWSIYDRQGANLGNINEDRFDNAGQILERMDIYIRDYIFDDLENCWNIENNEDYPYGYPWNTEEWLKLRDRMPNNQFEMDLCDMIANHFDEINLENVYYKEEE